MSDLPTYEFEKTEGEKEVKLNKENSASIMNYINSLA
jgi:hypothetical protein